MPMLAASRRAFLRGGIQRKSVVRPFGAVAEVRFHDLCTRCNDCQAHCPQAVIALDSEGYPFFDPKQGDCTFCGDCISACETGALDASSAWLWRAKVADSCLAVSGVQCRACEDHCDPQAIRFRLALGGRSHPIIDHEACTGCGGCISACPASAISLMQFVPDMEMATC